MAHPRRMSLMGFLSSMFRVRIDPLARDVWHAASDGSEVAKSVAF
jgi:hypothetical protein